MVEHEEQEISGGFVEWLGLNLVEGSGDRVVLSWKLLGGGDGGQHRGRAVDR